MNKIKQVKAYKIRKRIYATFQEAIESELGEISCDVFDAVFDKDGNLRNSKRAIRMLKKALRSGLETISGFEKEQTK